MPGRGRSVDWRTWQLWISIPLGFCHGLIRHKPSRLAGPRGCMRRAAELRAGALACAPTDAEC